jgi:hypothetical protein
MTKRAKTTHATVPLSMKSDVLCFCFNVLLFVLVYLVKSDKGSYLVEESKKNLKNFPIASHTKTTVFAATLQQLSPS